MLSACKTRWACFKNNERKRFLSALVSVFAWGLFAHGYCFANLTLSYDSLNEFFIFDPVYYYSGSVIEWKIALGRFLEPVYQLIFRGAVATPWIAGILSLIWLSISVWLVLTIFHISNPISIFLVGGIFTANLTVTATAATFITDMDAYMFALLLAVVSVKLWIKGGKHIWIGVLTISCVLGIYQSMLSVAITLVMLVCILDLINGEECKSVFLKGMKAIGMIAAGGGLYLLAIFCVSGMLHIELANSYNGITNIWHRSDKSLLYLVALTYYSVLRTIILQPSVLPASETLTVLVHCFLGAIAFTILISILRSKRLKMGNKALALALVLLLPLGMNISFILNNGKVHYLMMYAFWLSYFGGLLLVRWYCGEKEPGNKKTAAVRAVSMLLVAFIIYGNAQTANAAYVKKQMEQQSTLAVMNNVEQAIEKTLGYTPGETTVAFVGTPGAGYLTDAFSNISRIKGLERSSTIHSTNFYQCYYEYILQKPINICDYETHLSIKKWPSVNEMGSFPAEDSIQWFDDILVVKISD